MINSGLVWTAYPRLCGKLFTENGALQEALFHNLNGPAADKYSFGISDSLYPTPKHSQYKHNQILRWSLIIEGIKTIFAMVMYFPELILLNINLLIY